MLAFVATICHSARADDHSVTVRAIQQGNTVSFVASSQNLSRYTVTLTVTGSNLKSSSPSPISVDSNGKRTIVIARACQADSSRSWSYRWNWRWSPGGWSSATETTYVYALPYRSTDRHKVDQGFLGTYSHYQGSQNEYAVDFGMPIGTTVCAARGGVVVGVRVDSNVGGPDRKYLSDDNYIIIDHGDGTYGEYVHLEQNGSLVKLGQRVQVGTPIGLSGMTGYTSAPHLHFMVFHTLDGMTRLTLPMRFHTAYGDVYPKQGEMY